MKLALLNSPLREQKTVVGVEEEIVESSRIVGQELGCGCVGDVDRFACL